MIGAKLIIHIHYIRLYFTVYIQFVELKLCSTKYLELIKQIIVGTIILYIQHIDYVCMYALNQEPDPYSCVHLKQTICIFKLIRS